MTQNEMVAVDELVREIARALVDEPAAVEVQSVDRDENTVLKLRVGQGDRQAGADGTFGAYDSGRREHETASPLHPRHS